MGKLVRNSSGTIHDWDGTSAIPTFWTEVDGGGTLTLDPLTITTTNAQYHYLVSTNPLTITEPMLTRITGQLQATVVGDSYLDMGSIHDLAARPGANYETFMNSKPGNIIGAHGMWNWGIYNSGFLYGDGPSAGTDYVWEIRWDSFAKVYRRNATTLAIEATGQSVYSYTNNAYFTIGDGWITDSNGTLIIDRIHICSAYYLSVINLNPGNAVRVYDASDTVMASAVAVGGVATPDLSTTPLPLTGYIKTFVDGSYAVEIDRYPAAGNATDIDGGDEYQPSTDTPMGGPSGAGYGGAAMY
jgi:hypothetical protein